MAVLPTNLTRLVWLSRLPLSHVVRVLSSYSDNLKDSVLASAIQFGEVYETCTAQYPTANNETSMAFTHKFRTSF